MKMANPDLKETIAWANESNSEGNSNGWKSWLPVLLIVLLLVLAGWWWWMNYGPNKNDPTTSSNTFNDLKGGTRKANPLFVKANGRVVS